MGQVASLAERQGGFAPFKVGVEATMLFTDDLGEMHLVSGPIANITQELVVIDDVNVDGSTTRFEIGHHQIEERF